MSNTQVLLVDDDPRNVRLLEGIFRADGYEVDKAYSGSEALSQVAARPPDLVLLDVMMPHMSGNEVCERLKSDPATRAIPVILVTALNSIEDKVNGLDGGADDFVSKPVNRVELLAKARSLLRVKKLHDELAAAKEELQAKNDELVRLENLKESLMQMIVHDLKNPLTAIMGNLELVQTGGARRPERSAERITRALESSRGMMRMILDLLDIGRIEENRLPLKPEPFRLQDLFEECRTDLEGLLGAAGVAFEIVPAGDLPPLEADRALISRVVSNLLSNSIKHTGSGGRITLGARRLDEGFRIEVRDTGEGIPAEYLPHIVDKFGPLHLKKQGTPVDRGVGLSFCKLAVEAHGGRIDVESREGEGTTFRITLPAVVGAAQTTPALAG
jgi:signal transduction histidine kinase